MRALFVIVIPFVALWLGTKWELVTAPSSDVTVVFKDEKRETGALSRAWGGAYVLTKTDGTAIHFRDFLMIELEARPVVDRSFLEGNWRLLLSLVVGILLSVLLSWMRVDWPAFLLPASRCRRDSLSV